MGDELRTAHTFRAVVVETRQWCRLVRSSGLSRPWDMLFSPEALYSDGSSFDVGQQRVHAVVECEGALVAAYVVAMRENSCCLVDVRCSEGAGAGWADVMLTHWEELAATLGSESMIGPVGAFPFLTDGVVTESAGEIKSIHIPVYPAELVESFLRRGYVPAWTGAVWGRLCAGVGSQDHPRPPESGVRKGSWMTIGSFVRELESVLSASFVTLPWHRGRGADVLDLVRSYAPVFSPTIALLGEDAGQTVGAVLMYRDVQSIPLAVHSWPRALQKLWMWIASHRSGSLHVSVIGLLPQARNSRIAFDLFHATRNILCRAQSVTTSWVRTENRASQMMCARAGMSPLQQRTVFSKVLQPISQQ